MIMKIATSQATKRIASRTTAVITTASPPRAPLAHGLAPPAPAGAAAARLVLEGKHLRRQPEPRHHQERPTGQDAEDLQVGHAAVLAAGGGVGHRPRDRKSVVTGKRR